MSGHSDKKDKQSRQKANRLLLLSIALATGLYILINAYYFFFKGFVITKTQMFWFAFLSGINFCLYRLIDTFRGSYWESYMIDFLGLHLAVEVLSNISSYFWYAYFIYPAYFSYWAGSYIYAYVKTIGKDTPGEETPHQKEQQQPKQKTKFVKVRK